MEREPSNPKPDRSLSAWELCGVAANTLTTEMRRQMENDDSYGYCPGDPEFPLQTEDLIPGEGIIIKDRPILIEAAVWASYEAKSCKR